MSDSSRARRTRKFAREHRGAQAAIEATRNYWFVYDCLKLELDVSVANPHETGLIGDQKVKSDRLDAKRLAVLLLLAEFEATHDNASGIMSRSCLYYYPVKHRNILIFEHYPKFLYMIGTIVSL